MARPTGHPSTDPERTQEACLVSWRRTSAVFAVVSCFAWLATELTGRITSIAIVNRISFLALIWTFVAAWRADVPDDPA